MKTYLLPLILLVLSCGGDDVPMVQVGDPCDDGDLCTYDDSIREDYTCSGVALEIPELSNEDYCIDVKCNGTREWRYALKDGYCYFDSYADSCVPTGSPCFRCLPVGESMLLQDDYYYRCISTGVGETENRTTNYHTQ